MYKYEYDDYEEDDIDVKTITHLYQLRHSCNIYGHSCVAEELKVPISRIYSLYYSSVHGSNELSQFFKCTDDDFRKLVNKYKAIEKENQKSIYEVQMKNDKLIHDLKVKRTAFAGIGTNKAKRRLNKLSKTSDIAKAIRIALEIEDKNILAKDTYGEYRDRVYNKKHELILELCEVFKKNGWEYGVQNSSIVGASHIIYFEIPSCEQISWHFSAGSVVFPDYLKKWDGQENSTLRKLEQVCYDILKANNLDK